MEIENLNYCNKAISLEKDISKQFLLLGEYLYRIDSERLYEPQWTSFNEFIKEFKSLSQASVSKLLNIYSRFVIDYQIPEDKLIGVGGWTNIAEILPITKSKEDALEWIDKATVLTRSDLRKEISEKKTGVQMSECKHEDYYVIKVCKICHDKIRLEETGVTE